MGKKVTTLYLYMYISIYSYRDVYVNLCTYTKIECYQVRLTAHCQWVWFPLDALYFLPCARTKIN